MQPLTSATGAGPLWPFLLYSGLVLAAVGVILLVSSLLGERHRAAGRNIPYESGITPTGTARLRYGVHFYTVGVFFILFDVEAIFLYAWAVAMRELGWAGYVEIVLFILVLLLALVYIWRLGGLDWSPSRRRASLRAGPPRPGATREPPAPRLGSGWDEVARPSAATAVPRRSRDGGPSGLATGEAGLAAEGSRSPASGGRPEVTG